MNEDVAPFVLNMHDQCEQEENEEIYEELPWDEFTDEAKERFSPGYEVRLKCVADPKTGETWAVGMIRPDGSTMLFDEKIPV